MQPGDLISIPEQPETVSITGEVLYPNTVGYIPNVTFKDYISQAGGFSDTARKKKSYVVYANGTAKQTKSFLGFKVYPRIKPGADIFIPKKEAKQKLSTQEVLGITSSLATIALIIDRLSN